MQRGQWCPVTGRTEVLRCAGEVIQSLFPALQHRSVTCPAGALGPRLVLLRDSTDPGKQSTAAVQVLNNNSHSLCQRRDLSTACFCRNKWLRTSPQKTIWQEGKLRKSGGLPSGWGRNLAAAALAGHCGGQLRGSATPHLVPKKEPTTRDQHPSWGMQACTGMMHASPSVGGTNPVRLRLLKPSHLSEWSAACSARSALLNTPVHDLPRLAQQINNLWSCLCAEANTSCS